MRAVTVADINAEMLAVGRERAAATRNSAARRLRRGQCRGPAVRRRTRSTPLRSPSASATCRSIDMALARGVPRAEAGRPVPLPGILGGRRRRCSTASTSFYSFNVIPPIGERVAGDARALSLSGRIHPPLPQPGALRRDDRGGRLRARHLPQPLAAASPRSTPAGSSERDDARRRALPPGRRRLRARPRGRPSRSSIPTALPRGAAAAGPARAGCSSAAQAIADGPRRAADRGAQPARAVLRQARPVPRDAAGHRRRRSRRRARRAPRRDRAVSRGGGAGDDRSRARRAGRAALRVVLAAGRRRLDRPGPQGRR